MLRLSKAGKMSTEYREPLTVSRLKVQDVGSSEVSPPVENNDFPDLFLPLQQTALGTTLWHERKKWIFSNLNTSLGELSHSIAVTLSTCKRSVIVPERQRVEHWGLHYMGDNIFGVKTKVLLWSFKKEAWMSTNCIIFVLRITYLETSCTLLPITMSNKMFSHVDSPPDCHCLPTNTHCIKGHCLTSNPDTGLVGVGGVEVKREWVTRSGWVEQEGAVCLLSPQGGRLGGTWRMQLLHYDPNLWPLCTYPTSLAKHAGLVCMRVCEWGQGW